MNTAIDNPIKLGLPDAGSSALPVPRRRRATATWAGTAVTLVAAVVLTLWTADSCRAMDQPPQDSEQLRAWLVGHLVSDMQSLGVFDGNDYAKVPGIVDRLTDDQVALLAQYYFLIRSKTEQDAYLYALQQQGYSDEQVAEAKAPIADLLTVLNDQIVACYDEFMQMPQPVQYLTQICYASVPGWCCRARCFLPDWYFDNGCYVGPCFDSAYAGAWAVPVCNAYYDRGSRFYANYHNVANAARINRSINLAHRQADWFRHQGDRRSIVAHDRLVHPAHGGSHSPQPRIAAGTQHRVGSPGSTHDRRSAPALAGSQRQRPEVTRHQGFQSHASRIPAARPPKAQYQAAKAHANRGSAPHHHVAYSSPKSRAHSSHPQRAAHARPQPQHAAQAHSNSGHKRHG